MDDYLQDTHALEGMLWNEFEKDEIRNDAHIVETPYKPRNLIPPPLSLDMGQGLRTRTTMLLYNLKAMYGMSDACLSALLRYLTIKSPIFTNLVTH